MTERKLKCAIYTRKSTDEGLDQEFNSLDAQREACTAFIKSQVGEGWSLVKQHYDDGGYSGATMERPALQLLLNDIRLGKIDVVVVYKVDRLTRSLADFAKLVELFDENDVSFVSVTQAFNTTTSMGRLTLNVLLSFAQFEREVTAERIRDKIAASKKKGMWMGGPVPLGYDAKDKKLIVNETEAATVRTIFDLYIRHKSVRLVKVETDRLGLRTKTRGPGDGGREKGRSFQRGHLYGILSHPVYVGKTRHNGQLFDGAHEAIITEGIWNQAQALLEQNGRKRKNQTNAKDPSLLAGLVFDDAGDRLIPTHANKAGRRYRYYVSHPDSVRTNIGASLRLPAVQLEDVVVNSVRSFLTNKRELSKALESIECPHKFEQALREAHREANHAIECTPDELRQFVCRFVERVTITSTELSISILTSTLCDRENLNPFEIKKAVTFKRRGAGMKLILNVTEPNRVQVDTNLVQLVAQATQYFDKLRSGKAESIEELARQHKTAPNEISRILPLAFLAPDLVEVILEGRHPVALTANRLKRMSNLPTDWDEQRALFASL